MVSRHFPGSPGPRNKYRCSKKLFSAFSFAIVSIVPKDGTHPFYISPPLALGWGAGRVSIRPKVMKLIPKDFYFTYGIREDPVCEVDVFWNSGSFVVSVRSSFRFFFVVVVAANRLMT